MNALIEAVEAQGTPVIPSGKKTVNNNKRNMTHILRSAAIVPQFYN